MYVYVQDILVMGFGHAAACLTSLFHVKQTGEARLAKKMTQAALATAINEKAWYTGGGADKV